MAADQLCILKCVHFILISKEIIGKLQRPYFPYLSESLFVSHTICVLYYPQNEGYSFRQTYVH